MPSRSAPQMLCIVNSRAHARDVFARIAALDGAVHLTTLMCPAHRREVLQAAAAAPERDGLPVRLVATSLIEAGVDISFPEVWRASTGLDSIAQAAGRCNREGELLPQLGCVVVFTPAEAKPPRALLALPAGSVFGVARFGKDPLGLDAVAAVFPPAVFHQGQQGTRRGHGRSAAPRRRSRVSCPDYQVGEKASASASAASPRRSA